MKTKQIPSLICVLLVAAANLRGQAAAPDERDRLLVEDYKSLMLLVEDIPSNTVGISKDGIRARTELKMRAAGLIPAEKDKLRALYVRIYVVRPSTAFSIEIRFLRSATWSLPDARTAVDMLTTWSSSRTGCTPGSDGSYILSTLDGALDEFLSAYLKANQDQK